eukprot:3514476-Pyramimonas_sp.AAC.1
MTLQPKGMFHRNPQVGEPELHNRWHGGRGFTIYPRASTPATDAHAGHAPLRLPRVSQSSTSSASPSPLQARAEPPPTLRARAARGAAQGGAGRRRGGPWPDLQ